MASETTDPGARLAALTDLATPFAVRAAVTLGVPDRIAEGTTGLAELAAATGADADSLARLLRHLVAIGFVAEQGGRFALTDVSRHLLGADSAWQKKWLDLDGPGVKMDLAYAGMAHSVRTGRSGYEPVHGVPFWEDYQRDDALRGFFGAIMAAHAWQTGPLLAAEYDWSAVKSVIDIGGGVGALLVEVLRGQPHLEGAVLDLPPVAAEADEALAASEVSGRAEFVPGSFFDELPTGYDRYVVSRVLTDWPDADAVRILRRCAEAAGGTGRILVVEVLAGEEHAKNNSSFDLQSLSLLGGRERSIADFEALAAEAGLVVRGTRSWDGGLVLVECELAG